MRKSWFYTGVVFVIFGALLLLLYFIMMNIDRWGLIMILLPMIPGGVFSLIFGIIHLLLGLSKGAKDVAKKEED